REVRRAPGDRAGGRRAPRGSPGRAAGRRSSARRGGRAGGAGPLRRGASAVTAAAALARGRDALLAMQDAGGWWKGILDTNVTMDAEDLLLRQFLGVLTPQQAAGSAAWIRSQQRDDGTWAN